MVHDEKLNSINIMAHSLTLEKKLYANILNLTLKIKLIK